MVLMMMMMMMMMMIITVIVYHPNHPLSLFTYRQTIEVRAAQVFNFMRGLSLHNMYPISPFTKTQEEEEDENNKGIKHFITGPLTYRDVPNVLKSD